MAPRNTLVSLVAGAAGSIPQAVARIFQDFASVLGGYLASIVPLTGRLAAPYTNATGAYTAITTITITSRGTSDRFVVLGKASGGLDAAGVGSFSLGIDGDVLGRAGSGSSNPVGAANPVIGAVGDVITGLAAGSHTIALLGKSDAPGTTLLIDTTTTDQGAFLVVFPIPG